MLAVNEAARALGLRSGMSATEAQALLPNLATFEAEPQEDEAGLGRLAAWALRRYSPVVAADPPDGLVLDATGTAHLHGGEVAMLNDIVARLANVGVAARTAMASTLGSAHALARHHSQPIVAFGMRDGRAALAKLPISALRLPPDAVRRLKVLGFERVGDLLAQPRAPLVHRFGTELGRRIDQALGEVAEPITPVVVPDIVGVSRGFGEPISAPETLARHTGLLVADLCAALEKRGLGARKLDLVFQRVDSHTEGLESARRGRRARRNTCRACCSAASKRSIPASVSSA